MSPQEVRAAYDQLAAEPGSLVMLSRLRGRFPNVPRDELDRILRDLEDQRIIHLEPESNQKALTQADRDAALRLGPQDVHAVKYLPGQPSTASLAERHVRQAYAKLRNQQTHPDLFEWVSLTRLRPELEARGMSRAEQDEALRAIFRMEGVNLVPENNQSSLTPADRAAAIRIGGQEKYLISIFGGDWRAALGGA